MQTNRRSVLKGIGTGAATVGLAGCSGDNGGNGGNGGGGGGTTTQAGDDQTTTVSPFSAEVTVTHWPILFMALPYLAARDQGYFEENNINIEGIVGSSGGGTTVRNVVTGGLPFGEVSTSAAVNAYYAGAPISIIAGGVKSVTTFFLISNPDSDITEVGDLAGKTIGVTSPGSASENSVTVAVENSDELSVDDVEIRTMGGLGEAITGVSEGAVDAGFNAIPVLTKQQMGGTDWNIPMRVADLVPNFHMTCLIAGPDILEENPDVVRGYLDARKRGVEYVRENIDDAGRLVAEANDGYSQDVMSQGIEDAMIEDYHTTGKFSPDGLASVEQGMHALGLIDREVGWTDIVDQSFLPEDDQVDLGSI